MVKPDYTLIDYVRWMGAFSFEEKPFCDADALVLCDVVYFEIFDSETSPEKTLRELIQSAPIHDASIVKRLGGGLEEHSVFIQTVSDSRRFGEIRLKSYAETLDYEKSIQFAAASFFYKGIFNFIAFRGTDDTIAGWKEDFMISFTKTTAQDMALDYAAANLVDGSANYIGGHSKGGNMALYAASMLPDELQNRLHHVFDLDGPGFCEEVFDIKALDRIQDKATFIIPEFSIIGKLFEPAVSDTRIVRSTVSGILQHSLASWGIDHGELAVCEANNAVSRWISGAVREWIGNISQENRVVFIRELFDALSSGGARTVADLDKTGYLGREQILRRLLESSDVTRKIIADLPVQAVGQFISAASHFAGGKQRIAAGGPEAAPEEEAETAEQTELPFLEDSPLPLRETADKETAL